MMCVYVDDLFAWDGKLWCHMFCHIEDVGQLHKIADSTGLKRAWFQEEKPYFPHYDLSPNKRKLAIAHGAKEVTKKKMVQVARSNRYRLNKAADEREY